MKQKSASTVHEAKAANAKQYFNGRPCPSGHVAPRYTSNQACVVCVRDGAGRRAKGGDSCVAVAIKPRPFVHILRSWAPVMLHIDLLFLPHRVSVARAPCVVPE